LLSCESQEGSRVAHSRARRSASEGESAGEEEVESERTKAAVSKTGVVELEGEGLVTDTTGGVGAVVEVEGGTDDEGVREAGEERRARLAGGEAGRTLAAVCRNASASPSWRLAMLLTRESGRKMKSRRGDRREQGSWVV
jgi:hypothetical protein